MEANLEGGLFSNMINNPYQKYMQNNIMLSSPEKLLLMLVDGLSRFVKTAKIAIEEKDTVKANENLIKAQDIVAELMSSLNMDYEISEGLSQLYDFIYQRLIDANIKKDIKIIEEIEPIIEDLKNTWHEALDK